MFTSKKGEGVGNLIMFIAFILVAGVAASVLITSAFSLQNKATFTGHRTQEQISVGTEIVQMWGENSLGVVNGTVDTFYMRLRVVPGSSPIKLDDTFLGVDFDEASADLGSILEDDNYKRNCTFAPNMADSGFWTDTNLQEGNFSYEYLMKGEKYQDRYLNEGDVILICFMAPYPIGESDKVGVQFIPKPGTATIIETVTPDEILSPRVFLER